MTSAQLFYVINLLVYAGVDIIACLGLSQQFGVAGITNFGFIIFQAAGAYTAAILSLPSQGANGGFQSYIGGWNLPWPIPWIGAMIVGGLVALPFTFLVGRRLRGDFAAVGLLVTAVMANLLVTNYRPALNGSAGLSLVPAPLQGEYNPQSQGYQWLYAAVTLVLAAAVYWLVRRVTESPYGRSLRAMRDNDVVADSLGKNLHLAAHRDARARRRAGRAERRDPGRVHHPVGAVGVGLRGDHRAVRRRDHRRRGQPPRRGTRRDPGAGRFRGGHQVHPQHPREARPSGRPAMGGDRAADRALPLVPAAGGAARAPPQDRVRQAAVRRAERGCGDAGWLRPGAQAP